MKKYFLIFIGLLILSSCKDEKDEDLNMDSNVPVFSSNQIVTSEISVDDKVIEIMKDSIINFGSAEEPALFYVNIEHKINGIDVEERNSNKNGFRSLTREDIQNFILLWAYVHNMNTDDISETGRAYNLLHSFLLDSNIDLAVLISLSNTKNELKSSIELVNAISRSNHSGINTKSVDDNKFANNFLLTLEDLDLKPSNVIDAIYEAKSNPHDFMEEVSAKGIDLNATFRNGIITKGGVTHIIKAVIDGATFLSKVIVKFIESGKPSVNLENKYVAFLDSEDDNVFNYAGGKDFNSKVYSVSYCTLAKASFIVTANYGASHRSMPGRYIPRVGMRVNSVTCSGSMHVDGDVSFEPKGREEEDEPIAYCEGDILVNYGDCCCFSRHAYLKFTVDAQNGYNEVSWSPKK